MSKKTNKASLKEDKANPIVAKLLGAHPSEINVEKLRGITKLDKQPQLNGKLSKQLIKLIGNKFSVEIIFILDISSQNLKNISDLHECHNLLVLNISNNQISDIEPLKKLKKLKLLNAAKNEIMKLDTFEKMTDLVHLQLQGNYIQNLLYISPLEKCKNLKTLYLQNFDGTLQNEICKGVSYRMKVIENLKGINRLDGVSRSLKEYNHETNIQIKEMNLNVNPSSNSNVWFTRQFPQVEVAKGEQSQKENELRKDLHKCRELTDSIEERLRKYNEIK